VNNPQKGNHQRRTAKEEAAVGDMNHHREKLN